MRVNEHIAVSTSAVLLVPYDAHHVPRYHEWMEDPAIREATASDRLSLAEEHENQRSWRAAPDKLTFIVCEPLSGPLLPPLPDASSSSSGQAARVDGETTTGTPTVGVMAGVVDTPARMLGDINLFLTPWDGPEEEEEEKEKEKEKEKGEKPSCYCVAEIDIMIADASRRGKGLGRGAAAAFLRFVRRHLDDVLATYTGKGEKKVALRELVAKIHVRNEGSLALFTGLGFRRRGGVNYFGEVMMVLEGFGEDESEEGGEGEEGEEGEKGEPWKAVVRDAGYSELVYDRSGVDGGEGS
ncbi:hypothetical protein AAE478_004900 [Parahypoxylon ruwenzoriense]